MDQYFFFKLKVPTLNGTCPKREKNVHVLWVSVVSIIYYYTIWHMGP